MKCSKLKFLTTLSFVVIVELTGCVAGNSDETPFSVNDVSPENSAVSVPRDASIEATFNEDYHLPSIDDNSVLLTVHDQPVPGQIETLSSNSFRFTPNLPLNLHSSYIATLTTDISNLNGNGLDQQVAWTFQTQDGS